MDTPRDQPNVIGANIRDLRNLREITQSSLASQVNLDQSAIAKIESRKRSVSAEEAGAIARALGVTVERLLDYPGAHQDALLYTRVIAPQRDLEARLQELKRLVSGSEDGTLQGIVRRLRDGVEGYRAEVPDPYTLTASRELVDQSLAGANSAVERYAAFSDAVMRALETFAATDPEPTPRAKSREEDKRRARRPRDRGKPGGSPS